MKRFKTWGTEAGAFNRRQGGMHPWLTLFLVLACAVGISIAGMVALTLEKRAALYSYDVAESYRYDFEGTEAIVTPVEFVAGTIRLPSVGEGGHSAFLKVDVETTFTGRHVQPSVEVRSRAQTDTQYFERGAKGTRYINVSSFIGTNAVEIILQGRHVEFDAREIELVRFENDIPSDPTVLVLAPHPDDAEIAAYGFYCDIKDTYIVTVTAGDAGTHNYDRLYADEAEHFLKKGELRTWNSITVPMLCGIPPEQAVNLGFFDGTLPEMFDDKDADVFGVHTKISDINTFRKLNRSSLTLAMDGSANWTSLVGNLTRVLQEIKPNIIVTPHPVLDSLEDHRLSTIALFEAIKKAGLRDGDLYFYANHYQYNKFYPYGPSGGGVSLPPNFSDTIYFTAVYSHALSLDDQKDKMLSLEAMNDLRFNTDRRFSSGATVEALKAPIKDWLGFDDSYYRRAVRRNELFFIVEIQEIYDSEKFDLLTGMGGKNSQ